MPEWWSYTLSDFLLFSPRTYYRLLERYNEAVWPAHLVTLGLGLVFLMLLRRRSVKWQGVAVCFILALLWAWISWAFLWRRYGSINWAAMYFLPLFALQVLLLAWNGVFRRRLTFRVASGAAPVTGITLYLFSLFCYPALASLAGRSWHQSEAFGIAPDPTAMATIGLTLLVPNRIPASLLIVPVLWCLFSGLTLWAMKSPEAWVPPLAAVLGAGSTMVVRVNRKSHPDN
jgi:hypothetical protein